MSPYAYLPMLTHLVCHHTLTYQSTTMETLSALDSRIVAAREWLADAHDLLANGGRVTLKEVKAKCSKSGPVQRMALRLFPHVFETVTQRLASFREWRRLAAQALCHPLAPERALAALTESVLSGAAATPAAPAAAPPAAAPRAAVVKVEKRSGAKRASSRKRARANDADAPRVRSGAAAASVSAVAVGAGAGTAAEAAAEATAEAAAAAAAGAEAEAEAKVSLFYVPLHFTRILLLTI